MTESGCKVKEIEEYFSSHNRLGYSILAQSPLSQPIVHRNVANYRKLFQISKDVPIPNYAGEEGLVFIKQAEGQLIESYKQVIGDIPPWNKIGGDKFSRKYASESNYLYVIRAFSEDNTQNYLVSKSMLRELTANATYEWFEMQLHSIRVLMLSAGMSFEEAVIMQLKMNPYFVEQWKRIVDSKYLEKVLVV